MCHCRFQLGWNHVHDTTVGPCLRVEWYIPGRFQAKWKERRRVFGIALRISGEFKPPSFIKDVSSWGSHQLSSTPWFEKHAASMLAHEGRPSIEGSEMGGTTPSLRSHWNQECLLWADSACWARGRVPQTKSGCHWPIHILSTLSTFQRRSLN